MLSDLMKDSLISVQVGILVPGNRYLYTAVNTGMPNKPIACEHWPARRNLLDSASMRRLEPRGSALRADICLTEGR